MSGGSRGRDRRTGTPPANNRGASRGNRGVSKGHENRGKKVGSSVSEAQGGRGGRGGGDARGGSASAPAPPHAGISVSLSSSAQMSPRTWSSVVVGTGASPPPVSASGFGATSSQRHASSSSSSQSSGANNGRRQQPPPPSGGPNTQSRVVSSQPKTLQVGGFHPPEFDYKSHFSEFGMPIGWMLPCDDAEDASLLFFTIKHVINHILLTGYESMLELTVPGADDSLPILGEMIAPSEFYMPPDGNLIKYTKDNGYALTNEVGVLIFVQTMAPNNEFVIPIGSIYGKGVFEGFEMPLLIDWHKCDLDARVILQQMLQCVEFVHSLGIVWRDLKRSNFVYDPSVKHIRLIDPEAAVFVSFENGFVDPSLIPCGTPGYYLESDAPCDLNRDLYAVGTIIEEFLNDCDASRELFAPLEPLIKRLHRHNPRKRPSLKSILRLPFFQHI